jgi:hypothetical protein
MLDVVRKIFSPTISNKAADPPTSFWNSSGEFLRAYNHNRELWTSSLTGKSSQERAQPSYYLECHSHQVFSISRRKLYYKPPKAIFQGSLIEG